MRDELRTDLRALTAILVGGWIGGACMELPLRPMSVHEAHAPPPVQEPAVRDGVAFAASTLAWGPWHGVRMDYGGRLRLVGDVVVLEISDARIHLDEPRDVRFVGLRLTIRGAHPLGPDGRVLRGPLLPIDAPLSPDAPLWLHDLHLRGPRLAPGLSEVPMSLVLEQVIEVRDPEAPRGWRTEVMPFSPDGPVLDALLGRIPPDGC